jgi:hypothetical protein
MKKISLNSLVFLIDVTTQQVEDRFRHHEFISYDSVSAALFGSSTRPDMRDAVHAEIERQISLRLSLGQRVVVEAPDLKRDVRVSIAMHVNSIGYNVYYLVDEHGAKRDTVRNDRGVEVIDVNNTQVQVVNKTSDSMFIQHLKSLDYDGITVVGDVHGMMNQLQNAVSWAKRRNHFLLFLGDVLDYGNETLEVTDAVYQLVIRGEADALLGNHERKIFRYLSPKNKNVNHMRLSSGNKVTIDRVESLNSFDKERWVNRFNSLVHLMRNHRTFDNFIFAHGAVSPELWNNNDHRLRGALEEITLFGEVDDSIKRSDNFPNRVYNWVDQLLPGQTAIVGHDIRSNYEPFSHIGIKGGKAIFLDTGCGKGGHLSTLDIRFSNDGPRIENTNIH